MQWPEFTYVKSCLGSWIKYKQVCRVASRAANNGLLAPCRCRPHLSCSTTIITLLLPKQSNDSLLRFKCGHNSEVAQQAGLNGSVKLTHFRLKHFMAMKLNANVTWLIWRFVSHNTCTCIIGSLYFFYKPRTNLQEPRTLNTTVAQSAPRLARAACSGRTRSVGTRSSNDPKFTHVYNISNVSLN